MRHIWKLASHRHTRVPHYRCSAQQMTKKPKTRLEPDEVIQKRMDYFNRLYDEEAAKGDLAERGLMKEYLDAAQKAAEALAPYRLARLTPTDATEKDEVQRVV